MALFGKKKETKAAPVVAKKGTNAPRVLPTVRDLDSVIVHPRITEKAVAQSEQNVYTFVVRKDATKGVVADAVKALYNVTPMKVNIVNKRPTHRLKGSTNRFVKEAGMKKAYVYLKKGDTINLV
ncbi:MAG: 50S ribosomal protein L23 [Patescibacteria group bacterium]